jgi:vacuolar protein sorting-associated protein 3
MLTLGYEYPYIAALLPNKTIEVHNIETQLIVQVLSAPDDNRTRMSLMSCLPGGYLVPSSEQSKLMRKVPLKLKRTPPSER